MKRYDVYGDIRIPVHITVEADDAELAVEKLFETPLKLLLSMADKGAAELDDSSACAELDEGEPDE